MLLLTRLTAQVLLSSLYVKACQSLVKLFCMNFSSLSFKMLLVLVFSNFQLIRLSSVVQKRLSIEAWYFQLQYGVIKIKAIKNIASIEPPTSLKALKKVNLFLLITSLFADSIILIEARPFGKQLGAVFILKFTWSNLLRLRNSIFSDFPEGLKIFSPRWRIVGLISQKQAQ